MDDATKEDLLDILNEKQEEIEWLKAELDEANHSRELSDAECVTLRKERDEARRLYCIAFQEITENLGEKNTTESIAKEMGWDCFKENTDD